MTEDLQKRIIDLLGGKVDGKDLFKAIDIVLDAYGQGMHEAYKNAIRAIAPKGDTNE